MANIMEDIQVALNELVMLKIVTKHNNGWMYIDHNMLFKFNYTLIFFGSEVRFKKIDDLPYEVNLNLYLSDVVPLTAVKSYELLQIKSCNFSP